MKQILLLLISIFFFIALISCEKGNEVNYERDAILTWTGEYDVDGCGFFVEIDSIQYKPENEGIIPKAFKTTDTLKVTIQYIDVLYEIEYYCGDLPEGQKSKAIKLLSIDLNE